MDNDRATRLAGLLRQPGSLKHARRAESIRDGLPERMKVGRNEPCVCGSGRKFKRCCLMRQKGFVPCVMKDGRLVANVPGGPQVIAANGLVEVGGVPLGEFANATLATDPAP